MSSLDKCREFDRMQKALDRYSGERLSIAVDHERGSVTVFVLVGDDRTLFTEHLRDAIKEREAELIAACMASAKRKAIDQAESVKRSAASALERLAG